MGTPNLMLNYYCVMYRPYPYSSNSIDLTKLISCDYIYYVITIGVIEH